MYSTTLNFVEIGPVRAALTSFAAQTVRDEMVREVEDVVKPTSGLHVSIKTKALTKQVEWQDIGAATVSNVAEIIRKHQPLTWCVVMAIAGRKSHVRKGIQTECQMCLLEVVCN